MALKIWRDDGDLLTLWMLFLRCSCGEPASSSSWARVCRERVLDLLFTFLLPARGLRSNWDAASALENLIFFST